MILFAVERNEFIRFIINELNKMVEQLKDGNDSTFSEMTGEIIGYFKILREFNVISDNDAITIANEIDDMGLYQHKYEGISFIINILSAYVK